MSISCYLDDVDCNSGTRRYHRFETSIVHDKIAHCEGDPSRWSPDDESSRGFHIEKMAENERRNKDTLVTSRSIVEWTSSR